MLHRKDYVIMQLFSKAILLFCTVKLLLWDAALTESAEVRILFSTSDKKVNTSSFIKLNCIAYGRLSAPSVEWEMVTSGSSSTVRNSTSNRHTVCTQSKDTFTESNLQIEDTRLEDTGVYSCTARLNGTGSVLTARKSTTLTVLGPNASDSLGGAITGGILALLLLTGALVTSWYCRQQLRKKYYGSKANKEIVDDFILSNKNVEMKQESILKKHWETTLIRNTDKSEANIKELLVHKMHIKLMNVIGEGEFGYVYEGTLQMIKKKMSKNLGVTDVKVAVKTLKGSFDEDDTDKLIRESVLMHKFDHHNVLSLIGVCLDAGPSPYIILPFMENGSLLLYVKKNKANLCTNSDTEEDTVSIVQKQLTEMCLQIAKGMEYLANMKLIHRDLAARNCMIDENWVIKVADFGLSEVMTTSKDYFRQDKNVGIKLPVKWMAPESLCEEIFSEKSDVWSYGVTCWEIFSVGTRPYPGVHPMTLAKELNSGLRLYQPDNTACSDIMYTLMKSCWELEPELRPGFSQLVNSIDKDLQGMTEYLYVTAFAGFEHTANPE